MKDSNHAPLDDHLTTTDPNQQPYANSWFVGMFVGTALLGMASAYCRPYLDTGGIHWDAIISLIILVVINIAWLYQISRTLQLNYSRAYLANTFLLWLGYYLGWIVINDRFMGDLAFICGMGAFLGMFLGRLILYFHKG